MKKILAHVQYNADDYAYLSAKGWTNKEILARWDQEAKTCIGPTRWDGHWAQSKLASTIASN